MENLQEQNWQNIFGGYDSEPTGWYGIWTTYSPEQEVLKTYQGIRSFQPNTDHTVITHTNQYTYEDGSTESKSWTLEKYSCNQPDGVIHPAVDRMRAISLGQGANAWVSKKLDLGHFFGTELFFRNQSFRTSIAHLYNDKGQLAKVTQIREHQGSFPSQDPGEVITTILGNWRGEKQEMTSDLKISPPQPVNEFVLDPTGGKNECLFFPDGIITYPPKSVKQGEAFEIIASKFTSEEEYKRMTTQYDQSGNFLKLIFEVFHRVD